MSRAAKCQKCGGALVSISLRVTSGDRTMYSCSKCDNRTWDADGGPTQLADVLGELAATKVPRRNGRAKAE